VGPVVALIAADGGVMVVFGEKLRTTVTNEGEMVKPSREGEWW